MTPERYPSVYEVDGLAVESVETRVAPAQILASRFWLEDIKDAQAHQTHDGTEHDPVVTMYLDGTDIVGPEGWADIGYSSRLAGMMNVLAMAHRRRTIAAKELAELGFCRGDSNDVSKQLQKLSGRLALAAGRPVIHKMTVRSGDRATMNAWYLDPDVEFTAMSTICQSRLPADARDAVESIIGRPDHQSREMERHASDPKRDTLRRAEGLKLPGWKVFPNGVLNGYVELSEAEQDTALRIGVADERTLIVGGYELPLRNDAEVLAFNALMTLGRQREVNIKELHSLRMAWGEKLGQPINRLHMASALKLLAAKFDLATMGEPPVVLLRTEGQARAMVRRDVIFQRQPLVGDERLVTAPPFGKPRIHAPEPLGRRALMFDLEVLPFWKDEDGDDEAGKIDVLGRDWIGPYRRGALKASIREMASERRHKVLTAHGQIELAKAVEAGMFARMGRARLLHEGWDEHDRIIEDLAELDGIGQEALELMVACNARLVGHWARRMIGYGRPQLLQEAQMEGTLGLIHALHMYDYTKDVRIATYASWWIRNRIQRKVLDKYDVTSKELYAGTFDDTSDIESDRSATLQHEAVVKSASPGVDAHDVTLLRVGLEKALGALDDLEREAVRAVYGFGDAQRNKVVDNLGREKLEVIAATALAKIATSESNEELRAFL